MLSAEEKRSNNTCFKVSNFYGLCCVRVSTCRRLPTCSEEVVYVHSFVTSFSLNLVVIEKTPGHLAICVAECDVTPVLSSLHRNVKIYVVFVQAAELAPEHIDRYHFEVHQNSFSGDNVVKTTTIARITVERFGSWHLHNIFFSIAQ